MKNADVMNLKTRMVTNMMKKEDAYLAVTPYHKSSVSGDYDTIFRLLRWKNCFAMLRKWPHAMQKLAVQRWASTYRLLRDDPIRAKNRSSFFQKA